MAVYLLPYTFGLRVFLGPRSSAFASGIINSFPQ
jgi:hypothetical protein